MGRLAAALAALALAGCYEPGGRCSADADCLEEQVCGPDGLCVPGMRPPPGDPPLAAADGPYAVPAGGTLDVVAPGVLANDTDPGGAALSAVLVDDVSYGFLNLAPDGSFTYAPLLGFTGADSFTYRASNGTLVSDVTTVSITVGP